ncbi:protein yellow-like isoform X2 [Frankliniella occidentalis]|nr:protein yellow-like isoform X2 [Frankliniella occidentalis]
MPPAMLLLLVAAAAAAEPVSVYTARGQLLHLLHAQQPPPDTRHPADLPLSAQPASVQPFFGALPVVPGPVAPSPPPALPARPRQLAAGNAAVQVSKLQERFSWRSLDFAFPDERSRQVALQTGGFIPENNLPVGIEVWGDKLFVTVPRWRAGIPSTLNYISLSQSYGDSPRLVPYPDWKTNIEGNCGTGITTTYRIKADACDRLWVLDTGTVGIGNTTQNPCPYSILVFDLTTDTLLRRYTLRTQDTNQNTFIANIAVDVGRTCDDTFLYASDELGYGLIVYSWELNTSWRAQHGFFLPDPLKGDFNVAGLNFQWFEEGIFGLALSAPKQDGFRTLFFSPLASNREFAVSTRVLRDKAMAEAEESYHQYVALPNRGPNTHTTAQVMDDDGVLFYNLIDQNAVGCWNSRLPFTRDTQGVVDRDDIGLVFPSDVKVDAQKTLWVMSDRMPVFLISNSIDFTNDVNFRIYSAPIADLIRGTVCDVDQGNSVLPEHDTAVALPPRRAYTAPPVRYVAPAAPAASAAPYSAPSAPAVDVPYTATPASYAGPTAAAAPLAGPLSATAFAAGLGRSPADSPLSVVSGGGLGPNGVLPSSYSLQWWSTSSRR